MLTTKPGEIVRHKYTREPYLVIGKSAQGLYVVSLSKKTDPATMQIILPRAEHDFESDFEMVDMTKQEAHIITKKLPIIEAVQQTFLKK